MPGFFISYVYEDRAQADLVSQWAAKGLLGAWNAVMEQADVRAQGDKQVKAYISPLINGCAALVLLVGTNTHNHRWIDYEIQHANSSGLNVLTVRIPNTTGAPAKQAPTEETPLDPTALAKALAGAPTKRGA